MAASNSFVGDTLQSLKIGAIAIFGILVPGSWFWATATFYLAYLLGAESIAELKSTLQQITILTGSYLAWAMSFIIVYVTGSILRILPPDAPDSWSLRRARSRDLDAKIGWPDRFPYQTLPIYLRDRGLHKLAELVPWDKGIDNKKKEVAKRSKTFLHFIKLYIAKNAPEIANHLAGQEAFIRLLSGVYYSIILSIPIGLIGAISQRTWNEISMISAVIFVFNLFIIAGIIHAFHYQRLRELVMILSGYFLVGPAEKSPYKDVELDKSE